MTLHSGHPRLWPCQSWRLRCTEGWRLTQAAYKISATSEASRHLVNRNSLVWSFSQSPRITARDGRLNKEPSICAMFPPSGFNRPMWLLHAFTSRPCIFLCKQRSLFSSTLWHKGTSQLLTRAVQHSLLAFSNICRQDSSSENSTTGLTVPELRETRWLFVCLARLVFPLGCPALSLCLSLALSRHVPTATGGPRGPEWSRGSLSLKGSVRMQRVIFEATTCGINPHPSSLCPTPQTFAVLFGHDSMSALCSSPF